MKKPDIFSLPRADFFEQQENDILQQTTGLEAWKLSGADSPEKANPLQDSYWLQMEEAIRARISKPQHRENNSPVFSWKPVLAGMLIFLSTALVWQHFGQPRPDELAEAKLNQLNQEEISQYLSEDPAAIELTAQMAMQQVSFHELSADLPINTDELLDYEDLNETDFEPNL